MHEELKGHIIQRIHIFKAYSIYKAPYFKKVFAWIINKLVKKKNKWLKH